MLTFETLSRIAREEKSSPGLTKLPEGFFEEAQKYLSKKEQANEGKEDAWELESARMVLGDIIRMRERKLLLSAISYSDTGVEPPNMATEEGELFRMIAALVGDFRSERKRIFEEEQKENKPGIVFLEDVPKFVGTDLKEYGPFKKGDEAELPEELSEVLVRRGAARPIGQEEAI